MELLSAWDLIYVLVPCTAFEHEIVFRIDRDGLEDVMKTRDELNYSLAIREADDVH